MGEVHVNTPIKEYIHVLLLSISIDGHACKYKTYRRTVTRLKESV